MAHYYYYLFPTNSFHRLRCYCAVLYRTILHCNTLTWAALQLLGLASLAALLTHLSILHHRRYYLATNLINNVEIRELNINKAPPTQC